MVGKAKWQHILSSTSFNLKYKFLIQSLRAVNVFVQLEQAFMRPYF